MIKNISYNSLISLSILFAGVLIGLALIFSGAVGVHASSIDDIVYPVAELGGCENESECKLYCDDINHINECIAFAEEHNLMTKSEIKEAREFAKRGIRRGPGSCTTQAQCENYCDDINNIEECLAFAEEHDMIPEDELKEARQVAKALRQGAELPGGCTNKRSCEAYCEDSTHIEECVAFAEKAGFISGKELEEVRRIMPLMKSGQMPGGCTSKEQCEAYCEDENNIIECVAFAEKAGFMSPEEAEMVRKTGGKGPGDCKGRDECEEYCEDINNQDECFAFAREHGLIPEEDLARMKEGSEKIQQGLEHASPEVIFCLKDKIGPNIIDEINNGTFSPSRRSGDAIRRCFEENMPRPNFPPEVEQCVREVYGEDGIDRVMRGEIDQSEVESGIGPCVSESMRSKFEEEGFQGEHGDDFERERSPAVGEGRSDDEHNEFREEHKEQFEREFERERARIEHEIRSDFENEGFRSDEHDDSSQIPGLQLNFPPQADECLVKLYGPDYNRKMMSGEINPNDIQNSIKECMQGSMETQLRQTSAVFEAVKHFLSR